jgi:hypothetical protein
MVLLKGRGLLPLLTMSIVLKPRSLFIVRPRFFRRTSSKPADPQHPDIHDQTHPFRLMPDQFTDNS